MHVPLFKFGAAKSRRYMKVKTIVCLPKLPVTFAMNHVNYHRVLLQHCASENCENCDF